MDGDRFSPCGWNDLGTDVFKLLSRDWMLVTAGAGTWNTMTASWGGFGHLWNKDVAFVFVRPTRHTFSFMEQNEGFSLSFFGESHRRALEVCGAVSGRDTDKAAAAGLEPIQLEAGGRRWPAFSEARLVLGCRKLYAQDLDPACVVDGAIAANYPKGDWHRVYVGAIEAAWRLA